MTRTLVVTALYLTTPTLVAVTGVVCRWWDQRVTGREMVFE